VLAVAFVDSIVESVCGRRFVPIGKQGAWGAGWSKILRRESLSRLSGALKRIPGGVVADQLIDQAIKRTVDVLHFFLLAVVFLMRSAAVFAAASVSNPSTAENLRPID